LVVRRGDVAWAVAGHEVVVSSATARHVLDPTSAVLWQCLDGVSTLGEVFADIADVFALPTDHVAADCLPAIESWLATGIAVDVNEPAHAPRNDGPHGRSWRRLVDPPNT
jgi:predicted dinucleotide-binding enzyme